MSDSSPVSTDNLKAKAVGVATLTCTCPVCGETVISIEGQTISYATSHAISSQENGGFISINLSHDIAPPTAMHPGTINRPPWAVVDTLDIRPL